MNRQQGRSICEMFIFLGFGIGVVVHGGPSAARPQDTENNSIRLTLPPAPADNPTTPQKVELGKQLFFDPRLSGDNSRSCASCHLPDKAFTDGLPRALGVGGKQLARNTPTQLPRGSQTHAGRLPIGYRTPAWPELFGDF